MIGTVFYWVFTFLIWSWGGETANRPAFRVDVVVIDMPDWAKIKYQLIVDQYSDIIWQAAKEW